MKLVNLKQIAAVTLICTLSNIAMAKKMTCALLSETEPNNFTSIQSTLKVVDLESKEVVIFKVDGLSTQVFLNVQEQEKYAVTIVNLEYKPLAAMLVSSHEDGLLISYEQKV